MCHSTYKLLRTDTISTSPVQMDFSVIAQRTAKDNLHLNLISTQRWWALFWLAWLAVCVYLGLLWPNVISRAESVCVCVCWMWVCMCGVCQSGAVWTPQWELFIVCVTPRTKCDCVCAGMHEHACLCAIAWSRLISHVWKLRGRPQGSIRWRRNFNGSQVTLSISVFLS